MNQINPYQTQVTVRQGTRKSVTGKQTGVRPSTTTTTQTTVSGKKRPVGKMMLFGGVSLAAYLFLFSNEGLVTQTYTLGGWHAAYPVLTAFFFSFVHGAFASNLLSVIGLEAKKK